MLRLHFLPYLSKYVKYHNALNGELDVGILPQWAAWLAPPLQQNPVWPSLPHPQLDKIAQFIILKEISILIQNGSKGALV